MKVWNGSSWVKPFFAYPKVWNDSTWKYSKPKIWTGNSWSMPSTDSKTVTVGSAVWSEQYIGGGNIYGYGLNVNYSPSSFGSLSSNNKSQLVDQGGTYGQIAYEYGSTVIAGQYYEVRLIIRFNDTQTQYINSNDWGWNYLIIGPYSYNRADASYYGAVGYSQWSWSLTSSDPNPFGTTDGATRAVSWS